MQNTQAPIDNGQWEKYTPEDIPRIPTWGPDLPGQPGTIIESEGRQYYLGASLEGGLIRDEMVVTRNSPEPGRVMTIKTNMGDIAFWPNDMARKGMDGLHVTLGDTVRIVYLGKRKSIRNPTRSYKAYEVYKMRGPAQAQSVVAPHPRPVSDEDREASFQSRQKAVSTDKGVEWIEGQKSGLSQVPSAAEQGSR